MAKIIDNSTGREYTARGGNMKETRASRGRHESGNTKHSSYTGSRRGAFTLSGFWGDIVIRDRGKVTKEMLKDPKIKAAVDKYDRSHPKGKR